MPSLKDYRLRIASVKNTRKITSAMKMVAASKLRQAQARAEAGRPYAQKMREILARLILAIGQREESIPLLDGTGHNRKVLIIAVAVDRGLCGGFNTNLVREVRRQIVNMNLEGKEVTLVTVGRRARDMLKRDFPDAIIEHFPFEIKYNTARSLTQKITDLYAEGAYDVAYLAYSQFKNVISQIPVTEQVVPFVLPTKVIEDIERKELAHQMHNDAPDGVYSFEPDPMTLLKSLISQQIAAKIYSVLLEVGAGEQAAKMTAMDNATRNAGDMINGLTLQYNRARQAYITKEMTEIVSGVEASS